MKINGKDEIPYIVEKKNVWNHQPGFVMICVTFQGTDGVQHSILGLEAEDGQEKTTDICWQNW